MAYKPEDLYYTEQHEWLHLQEDGLATIGITAHAQEALGDLVFIELPEPGKSLKAGEECLVVESVKAASEVYAPVSGEVVEVNEALADGPEKVNQDPYGEGWMCRVKPDNPEEIGKLLRYADYQALLD